MPTIYQVQAPDGSILEIEGPDDATDEEIAAFAAQQYGKTKPSGVSVTLRPDIKDAAQREQMGLPPLPSPETTAEGTFGALTRGLAPAAMGAGLGGMVAGPPGALAGAATATLAPLVGDPIVQGVNKLLGTDFATPTEAMENLLTAIGVPEAKSEAERIIQSAASAVGAAAGGVGLGRTLAASAAPVTAAVGEALAAQPGAQLAGGAGGGASAQLAAEMGAGPLGQTAAGLAGGLAGGGIVPRPRQPLPAIVGEAEATGIPLMTSDVVPPRTFVQRNLQMAGERIPIAGTGLARQAQQEARVGAVRDVLTDYGALDPAAAIALPGRIVADVAQKRSATIQQYSALKQDVIDRLASAGAVPMQAANQRIDDLVAELRRRKTREGDEAANVLLTIKDDLQGRNLFELEAYRRDVLANIFKDDPTRPMSVAVREAGEKALRQVYDPVRQAMGAFIRQNGERRDFDKWMVANKRLSEEAGELAKQSLTRVLRQGDATPEVVETMLLGSKPSDVAALYRNMSPRGRTIAQQAIMARIARKSVDGDNISPEKFASEVKRLGDNIGVFFNADERARLEGLARVLSVTKRAGEAGVVTATGMQNYAPTAVVGGAGLASMFGGGITGFLGAMASIGSAGVAARIYESAPVRNLLLQASKTTNRDRLVQIAQRLEAIEAANVGNNKKDDAQ